MAQWTIRKSTNSAPKMSGKTETSSHARITPEAIAQRAYEKFLARGGNHGDDQRDWFEAERELNQEAGRSRN